MPGQRRHEEAVGDVDPPDLVWWTKWLSELRTSLAETLGGVLLRGARAVPVGSGDLYVSGSAGRLVGYSLRETVNTDFIVVEMFDSPDPDVEGELVASVTIGAGLSKEVTFAGAGVSFQYGLRLTAAGNGTLRGVVYLGGAD